MLARVQGKKKVQIAVFIFVETVSMCNKIQKPSYWPSGIRAIIRALKIKKKGVFGLDKRLKKKEKDYNFCHFFLFTLI